MDSSGNGHGPAPQVYRATSLTPSLVAAVVQFHRREPKIGYTLRRSLDLLRGAMGDVTQVVLAVASTPDLQAVTGYAWLSQMAEEPVVLINQVWGSRPSDTALLHEAGTRWACEMGATTLRAWGQPDDAEAGLRLYTRYGFVPRAILVEKSLGVSVMTLTRERHTKRVGEPT